MSELITDETIIWQPIDECPKEGGRTFLMYKNNIAIYDIAIAYWKEDQKMWWQQFAGQRLWFDPTHFAEAPRGPSNQIDDTKITIEIEDLKPGDTVCIMSGGPAMTIGKITNKKDLQRAKLVSEADCFWCADGVNHHSNTFPIAALKKCKPD